MVRVRTRIANFGDAPSPTANVTVRLQIVWADGTPIPGVPAEIVHAGQLAPLPKTSGYDLPTAEIVTPLPNGSNFSKAFLYGVGVRASVTVTTGAFEHDTTNNDGAQSWYLKGLLEVHAFVRVAVRDNRPELLRSVFAGRMTLGDAVELAPLFEAGVLAPPRHVAPWARDLRTIAAALTFSAFLSRVDLAPVTLERFVAYDARADRADG